MNRSKDIKMIKTFSIRIPEYHVRKKPDAKAIGLKLDEIIKREFMSRRLAIRCISSQEHKRKSISDLVRIVKRLGTDRYDSCRVGDRYGNREDKCIDFFALDFKVSPKSRMLEKFIEPFYSWPISVNQKPIRLDLAILYERSKVKRVVHTYDGQRKKRDGFVFKDQNNKPEAIVGIIKIL
ncbi:MAG: hypothetical protein ABIB04_01155 [Patescibacteria group bacterium]